MSATGGPVLRVVPIAEADLDVVAPLVNRAFHRYSEIFPTDRTSPTDYRDEAGPEARIFLVEDGGRLVATGMVAPSTRFMSDEVFGPAGTPRSEPGEAEHAGHPWTGALYFGFAGVEPDVMSKGLGRMLVHHAEETARAEGYTRMALGTVREFGLVDYYERFGYYVVHEVEHPIGHWEFLVPHHYCEMVKDL
jgi:GNAT superfamily N-acetyltransferase